MGKLTAFTFVTLNGYFEGPKGDVSWHRHGAEESKFAGTMLEAKSTLLFGRVTYEHMASYWPTPHAIANVPMVARGMNSADKIVFSRTLKKAEWSNTKLVKDDIGEAVRKAKQTKNLTLLGSGSILAQFAEQGLIDEYQIMVDPVVLAKGTPLFKGIKDRLNLELTATRAFASGVVLLCYRPAEQA